MSAQRVIYERSESIPPSLLGTYWRGGSAQVWEEDGEVWAGWRYLGHKGFYVVESFGPVTEDREEAARDWADAEVDRLSHGPLVIVWAEDDPDYDEEDGDA